MVRRVKAVGLLVLGALALMGARDGGLKAAATALAQPRPGKPARRRATNAAHRAALQHQALFYMTRGAKSVQSFTEHADKIDVIVPTWYSVDRSGSVTGQPDAQVLRTAKEHHVAVMPIVSAWGFHPDTYHAFLNDRRARARLARALVVESRRYGYRGFQIDFEGINWTDREALTATVEEAAAALHRAGYEISIATVPNMPGLGAPTAFGQWLYHHWGGAYDLTALGKSVDLICLMTYDEHTRFTPPGPVAGYEWTVEQLDDALKRVPKRKLSLGIPLYGYCWSAGRPERVRSQHRVTARYRPNVRGRSLSAPAAMRLALAYHGRVRWDAADRTAWFYFYRGGRREWVFYTDTRTFAARLNLAKRRGLEGFCAWVLGDEDPGIWKLLPTRR